MSYNNGPKIVTNGLLMYLDAANIKSFRGEPTINIVQPAWSSWGIDGSGQGSIGSRTIYSDYYCRIVDSAANTRQSIMAYNASPSTTYTFSVKYRKIAGAPTLRFQIQPYAGATAQSSVFPTTAQIGIIDTDGWQTATHSVTGNASTDRFLWFMQDGDDYTTYTHTFELKEAQVEAKTYYTPFVSGSRGTSVATGGGLYDLTNSNNNGTLTNGPLFDSDGGGSISFDGTNDYSNSGTTPTSLQGDPNITVIGFFKRTSSFSTKGFWGIGGSNAGGVGQGICNWNANNTNEIAIDTWSQSTFTTGQTYPLNTWIGVCWRKVSGPMTRANCTVSIFDGKNITNYTGASLTVLRSEATINLAINSTGGLTIGSISVDTGYCVPVKVGNISIYNKVLSDIEVLRCFNATKGRFGIK